MWCAKNGEQVHVLNVCPLRVAKRFQDDLVQSIASRHFARKGDGDAEAKAIATAGPFLAPIWSLCKKLGPMERGTLVSILGGNLYLNFSLYNMGYEVDPVCTNCNEGFDTIYHRCFTCPKIETRATTALGSARLNKVVEAGPNFFFANRCVVPVPHLSQCPSSATIVEFVNFAHGDVFSGPCMEMVAVFGQLSLNWLGPILLLFRSTRLAIWSLGFLGVFTGRSPRIPSMLSMLRPLLVSTTPWVSRTLATVRWWSETSTRILVVQLTHRTSVLVR